MNMPIEKQNNCVFAILNDPPCIITKDGRVFSKARRSKQLIERKEATASSGGYLRVSINNKRFFVHQLSAKAWLGECPEGLVVDHIDRNKMNNSPDNLRYCTYSENIENKDGYSKLGLFWGKAGSEERKIANREYCRMRRERLKNERSKTLNDD